MSIGLIKRANVNICEHFGDKLENMRFKGCPIFKPFLKPLKGFNIPSGHNDKYWMIANILNKCLVSLDNFEILVKWYFSRIISFLIINKDGTFTVSWSIE